MIFKAFFFFFFLLTAHCTQRPKCSHRTSMIQETWQAFSSMILHSWRLTQPLAQSAGAEPVTGQMLPSSAGQVGPGGVGLLSVLPEIYTVRGAWRV